LGLVDTVHSAYCNRLRYCISGALSKKTEFEVARKTGEVERKIAQGKQWQETFEAYIDRMTDLMLNKGLRNAGRDSEANRIAQTRTLAVLRNLDGSGKGEVVRFLIEAELLNRYPMKLREPSWSPRTQAQAAPIPDEIKPIAHV
jgi:hypothetical protein